MTAAIRKTPTATNGGSDNGTTYAAAVDAEIEALWKCVPTWLTSVSGTNTITAASDTTLVAAITAYVRPMAFWVVWANDNTGACQINIDGVGLIDLKDATAAALQAGALKSGHLDLIVHDGTRFRVLTAGGATSLSPAPALMIREEQTAGTSAGTFNSGSFVIRNLNAVVRNVLSGASLSTNQFTLPAGTFFIQWAAPALAVAAHQSRLFNVTDSAVVEVGTSAFSSNAGTDATTESTGATVITLTTSKVFRIEHRCGVTQASNGLGVASSLGAAEVYSRVNVWKA